MRLGEDDLGRGASGRDTNFVMMWLRFVFLPLIVLMLLETVEAVIAGGILHLAPRSLPIYLATVVTYWLLGGYMYRRAPYRSKVLCIAYGTVLVLGVAYVDLLTVGIPNFFIPAETLRFDLRHELSRFLGIYLGAYFAWQPDVRALDAA